jgi:hypothetical protein
MISPDTDIVVRLPIADDASQTARARKLFGRRRSVFEAQ